MENIEVAKVLEEIGNLLELQGENPFRIRAYRNASETLRSHSERIEDMVSEGQNLSKLQGIGKSTASKIVEIIEKGTCDRLEELREITPSGLLEMTAIPGLGPKKVMAIFNTLSISTVDALKDACENGELAGQVPGMGGKSEAAILAAIETLPEDTGRLPLRTAMKDVREISAYLDELESVVRYEVAGSFRRGRETVHDIDFLLLAPDHIAARDDVLEYPTIRQEIAAGKEKASVRLEDGLQVDFRFVDASHFGSALMYFTGSKHHNIQLRMRSIERGWKLSEYGLFDGETILASKTEEEVYDHLGLPWIPPELREDRGELMVAEDAELPDLVQRADLLGDMHLRPRNADAARAMVELSEEADFDFVVLLSASEKPVEVEAHIEMVAALDDEMNAQVVAGVVVSIDDEGGLALPATLLERLDWVVGSVRGGFGMNESEMTARVVAAVESGALHCLTHPLGRSVDYTARIPIDLDAVLRACATHQVCIEVGSHPHELETPEVFYRSIRDAGVQLALGSEATRPEDLWGIDLALKIARRSWCVAPDVRNTDAL